MSASGRSSGSQNKDPNSKDGPARPAGKPFVGVYFKCCHAYSRVYKNQDGTGYAGNCPKCRSPIFAPVGDGGTTRRMFEAE
ncbi:MAG: hypothetical protein ACI9S8_001591 [Chlamydiales bacterium]|jgi:hypothetical protein